MVTSRKRERRNQSPRSVATPLTHPARRSAKRQQSLRMRLVPQGDVEVDLSLAVLGHGADEVLAGRDDESGADEHLDGAGLQAEGALHVLAEAGLGPFHLLAGELHLLPPRLC